jgi:hypothetical protein
VSRALVELKEWQHFGYSSGRKQTLLLVESLNDSYLVDPASSHMLVSKIKPCKSKYKHLYCETAESSLYQL